jgi:hypothetical protein
MTKYLFFISFTFLFYIDCKSQNYLPKDTIFGNVKTIKEKVVFLTETENPQLLYYDDYGHSGFMGPESTIARFKNTWYTSNLCYYINYERKFDKKGNIINDVWYGKKNDFLNSYKKTYNTHNKKSKEVDSTKYSNYTTTYYYSDYGDLNIIRQNSKNDYFRHTYKKYNKERLTSLKEFDENGTVDEYNYIYNKKGKLIYRIYKNPNSWKQEGERSWSYGVQDSILTIYKDILNFYDDKNRLIKNETFDLYEDSQNHITPLLTNRIENEYKNDNLVFTKRRFGTGMERYDHYSYDKLNRISERYCCDIDKQKAMIIEKYKYNDGYISQLEYIEEGKKHNVSFKYKFDSYNNWIEIIKKVDGKDLFKWSRQIEYY